MHRLWLLFAQAVTVAVAIVFVVQTLQPGWLAHTPLASATGARVFAIGSF